MKINASTSGYVRLPADKPEELGPVRSANLRAYSTDEQSGSTRAETHG